MRAQDRTIKDWMTHIKSKRIALPRFQRFEAWEPTIITDFLTSTIRGLPVGVLKGKLRVILKNRNSSF